MLLECLPAAIAYENLHNPALSGGLDAEGVLELAKLAGYSEEAAQKAAKRRGEERMKRDLPP